MRLWFGLLLAVSSIVIAACNAIGSPTMVVMVVTSTPDPDATEQVRVVTATPDPNRTPEVVVVTATAQTADVQSVDTTQDNTEATAEPQDQATEDIVVSNATPTVDPRPTAVLGEVFIAEQQFEHGWMFWIQPLDQIWVLAEEDGLQTWTVYDDTYSDGQPSTDENIVPPEGLLQPERGFGKLWREDGAIQELLGWAITPEVGYKTRYEYHAGGTVSAASADEPSAYIEGPGHHIIQTSGAINVQLNEADRTWEIDE